MRSQFDGGGGLVQRKLVRDEAADIQFSRENQFGNVLLEQHVGGVAANQIFFVHANGGEIQLGRLTAARVGEQQNLTAAAEQGLRFADDVIGWDGDDCGIEAATAGHASNESGEVLGDQGGRLFYRWIRKPLCAEITC